LTRRPQPGEVCYNEDAECLAAREQWRLEKEREDEKAARNLERKQAEWTASYGALSEECEQRKKEREVFAGCQKSYGPTCNPNGFAGQSACVEHRMSTSGPTEKDARALLQKEWDAKAKASKKRSSEKKDSIHNNFLD